MRKAIVAFVLIVVGAKYGMDYLFSPKFQAYADATKAPWTCTVNMVLAGYLNMLSRYEEADPFFLKIIERCPDTSICEKAEFEHAKSLESQGLLRDAAQAYLAFAAKYPGTRRARLATKSAGMLQSS